MDFIYNIKKKEESEQKGEKEDDEVKCDTDHLHDICVHLLLS